MYNPLNVKFELSVITQAGKIWVLQLAERRKRERQHHSLKRLQSAINSSAQQ